MTETETDPWQPEVRHATPVSPSMSEMIGTAAMVIRRMYSSDDPGELQSGRAVVQALYPLIAAAERRAADDRWNRLREHIRDERKAQDQTAADQADIGHEPQSERAYGRVEALDQLLATMDWMEADR